MAEKKDPIRNLIDSGRRAGKLTSTEISDAMEEAGNVLEVEAMEKLYEELESNGIEVIDDTPVEVDDTVAAPDDGADDYEDGLTSAWAVTVISQTSSLSSTPYLMAFSTSGCKVKWGRYQLSSAPSASSVKTARRL